MTDEENDAEELADKAFVEAIRKKMGWKRVPEPTIPDIPELTEEEIDEIYYSERRKTKTRKLVLKYSLLLNVLLIAAIIYWILK